jgi:hypothetical protein
MRERAQQSWPALSKTAYGAAAAARSRSASAKITFADLPPSSSVTRLIVAAAPRMTPTPTSVEPVKPILATSGCSTSRWPTTEPLPTTTLTTPSGMPASSASSASGARERRQLGRLEHDRVAAGERRAELPGGDVEREVPRHDQPDDAERLAEGHVDAAGDRDRRAVVLVDRACVVVEDVGDHADSPRAPPIGLPTFCDSISASSSWCSSTSVALAGRQRAQQAAARENANVMREALVTHAMPQKICPIVEIRITALAPAVLSAVSKIASAGKPAS